MADKNLFCKIEPWMVAELKLSGHDLLIFAWIHSISKCGESVYTASAETISKTWFGDDSHSRAVKDCLKSLVTRGYITQTKCRRNGVTTSSYRSNGLEMLQKVREGAPVPVAMKKRRNKTSGTVPCGKEMVPYHPDSGTVPLLTNGTVPSNTSGTVPPPYIEEMYKKYCFNKEIAINSKEEKEAYEVVFFFRNAVAPRKEVDSFFAYNELNNWGAGKYMTFSQRLILADKTWKIKEAGRLKNGFIHLLYDAYVYGKENNIPNTDCLLDPNLKSEVKDSVLYITCTPAFATWMTANAANLVNDILVKRNLKLVKYLVPHENKENN